MPGTIGAGELTAELNAWHKKPSVVEVDAPPVGKGKVELVVGAVRAADWLGAGS